MTDQIISAPVSNEVASPVPEVSSFDVSNYFSEELRRDPDFERLSKNIPNDPSALVKDLYHKTKHFGKVKETIRAELEAEFNKPVTYKAEDYKYDLPENYKIEDELLSSANNKAAELGIKPEQLKGLMESILQADSQHQLREEQLSRKADEEALSSLKKEWGIDYEKKVASSEKMLQFLLPEGEDAKIQNLPTEAKILLAKLMDKVSQKISEPTIGRLNSPTATAQDKINDILNNKDHAYHKGSNDAVQEVARLYKEIATAQLSANKT
jgi:hypothetical protein